MTNDIIDSLKDWFENEWLYERHLTSEFMKDKEAFEKGCVDFDQKEHKLPVDLYLNLKKEAGLAEIAKVNKSLLKYAYHNYRMVELVFNLIFSSNIHDTNKSDTNTYLRLRMFNYLGSKIYDNDLIRQKYNFEIIAGVQNLTCYQSNKGSKKIILNLSDIITYVPENTKSDIEKNKRNYSNINKFLEFEREGITYLANYKDILIRKSVPSINSEGFFELERIGSISKCEKYFKQAFYFDLNKNPRKMSVQLNAFFSLKHYRDLYSHNISSYSHKVNIINPSYEDEKYLKNPELILESDYFKRYVDNVISLYANFIDNPYF